MTEDNPLETLLNEMNEAANAGLGIVALSVAVSIPAICASLAMKDGRSGGDHYKAWCADNLNEDNGFRFLTPEELYSMRNGFLHQARAEIASFHNGQYTFPYPHKGAVFTCDKGGRMGENSSYDRYINSVTQFCQDMANAARNWLRENRDHPHVAVNLEKMMTYRPLQDPGIQIIPAPRAIY